MDFGALPPEINSALMYGGAGAGPMLAASAAWDGLATELEMAANSYASMVSALTTGPWQGPSSTAMAAAAAPYVAWMNTTVAQSQEAASGARAAVAAYESAFAATVPPPVIALNRAELMMLVATNFFGQNTPAIAANQTEYAEMWAQDAAAMYGYAGNAAAASAVTPFTAAPQTTSQAGLAAQAATVATTDGTAAGSQLLSSVPSVLQSLATPLASTASTAQSTSGLSSILSSLGLGTAPTALLGPGSVFSSTGFLGQLGISSPVNALTTMSSLGANSINGTSMASWVNMAPKPSVPAAAGAASAAAGGAVPAGLAGLGGGGPVAASLGNGASLGRLSVPPGWTGTSPSVTPPAATSLPAPGTAAGGGTESMLGGVPLAGLGGRGSNVGMGAPRYGFRLTVMAHPLAAG